MSEARGSLVGNQASYPRSNTNDGRVEYGFNVNQIPGMNGALPANASTSHGNYPRAGAQPPGGGGAAAGAAANNANAQIQINNPISIYHVYFTQQSQRASLDLKKKLEPFEKQYLKY